MDTSKKCCKRRCQQQALAQRQTCKQHTGQRLPHLIPVRPVQQQNSTQVLLAEQKLAETPSEYEEFYDCLSESDVQKETTSRSKHKSRTPNSPEGNFRDAKVFETALKEIRSISEKLFKKYDGAMRQQVSQDTQRSSDDTTACSANKSISSWNSLNAALSEKFTERSTDTAYTEKCTTDTSAKDTNCETSKILLKPIPLMIPVTVQPYIYRSDIENSERQQNARKAKSFEPIRTSIIAGSGKMAVTDTSSEQEEQLPCYPMISNEPSQIDTCCGVTDYNPVCRHAQEEPEDISTGDSTTSSCSCISEPSSCCCNIEILPEPIIPEPEPDVLLPPAPPPKPQRRPYRLAIPQHKEMNLCCKCRFDPSPLINENGEVFCPGNCGCCLCPWKYRLTESKIQLMKHDKIKVCRCRDRGTIFTDFQVQPQCSQMSYFDVCPCREIAEEKCLELYDKELWNAKTKSLNEIEERRVSLSEVVEVHAEQ